MAVRQRQWAKKTRDKILSILTPVCRECGAKEELEFDCIRPMGDRHHKMEWSHRMSFYRKQYFNFNLQILCESCNKKKHNKELDEQPF